MQEVSVKPRSFFKHSIVCDAVGKEIHWSFTTKNKNISFGLFFRKTGGGGGGAEEAGRGSVAGHIPPSTTISAVASFSASLVPEPLNSRDSKDLVGRSSLTAAPLSPSLPTDSALKRINSKGSSGATKSNHHNHNHHHCPFGDDLEEIIPVSHFESSKFTVRGSHLIKETPGPGTYVLLFDNTFSVNTSKKLNFSVAIKDPDISVVSKKTEYEGWIYKKGNRKRQGYSKRWLKVDSNGYLQYFKSSHR